MMENPSFDESQLNQNHSIYKKVKPTIDKEKAKNIPGMIELWNSIDKIAQELEELKKIDNPSVEERKRLYYLNHYLIQLRTQQYYLMDSQYPTIIGQKNKAEYHGSLAESHLNYPILPRGLMSKEQDFSFMYPRTLKGFDVPAHKIYSEEEIDNLKKLHKPFIDFRDFDHLYQLIQHYGDIEAYIEMIPDSPLHNLLWTLDFYIQKARLSDQQMLIIRDKKLRIPNKEIAQHLQEELGIYHQENYISTIWNKSIKLIIEAVELNYDEFLCRNYDKAWKTCSRCKKELLRDPRNFVKKTKASDGLTGRCKCCDREVRQMNK